MALSIAGLTTTLLQRFPWLTPRRAMAVIVLLGGLKLLFYAGFACWIGSLAWGNTEDYPALRPADSPSFNAWTTTDPLLQPIPPAKPQQRVLHHLKTLPSKLWSQNQLVTVSRWGDPHQLAETVLVLPLAQPGMQRSYHDVGELVAQAVVTELSQLSLTYTRVIGPAEWQTLPLRTEALHAWNRIQRDIEQFGQPSPQVLIQFNQALVRGGQPPITRLLLVDSGVDFNNPYQPTGWKDTLRSLVTDALPQKATYNLTTRLWGFRAPLEAYEPGQPLVSVPLGVLHTQTPVNADELTSVTASVYTLDSTAQTFRTSSLQTATQLVKQLPAQWLLKTPGEQTQQAIFAPTASPTW